MGPPPGSFILPLLRSVTIGVYSGYVSEVTIRLLVDDYYSGSLSLMAPNTWPLPSSLVAQARAMISGPTDLLYNSLKSNKTEWPGVISNWMFSSYERWGNALLTSMRSNQPLNHLVALKVLEGISAKLINIESSVGLKEKTKKLPQKSAPQVTGVTASTYAAIASAEQLDLERILSVIKHDVSMLKLSLESGLRYGDGMIYDIVYDVVPLLWRRLVSGPTTCLMSWLTRLTNIANAIKDIGKSVTNPGLLLNPSRFFNKYKTIWATANNVAARDVVCTGTVITKETVCSRMF